MRTTLLISIAFCCLSGCLAQIPGFGSCPNISTVEDFDATRYVGKWYESHRYFTFFEFGSKCGSAVYGLKDNGTITVFNKGISSWTGKVSSVYGIATANSREPAKLRVRFPDFPVGDYWVVDTDYDNYAIIWACSQYGYINAKFSWILTRQREPVTDVLQMAYDTAKKNGISKYYYMKTDQKNCPEEF